MKEAPDTVYMPIPPSPARSRLEGTSPPPPPPAVTSPRWNLAPSPTGPRHLPTECGMGIEHVRLPEREFGSCAADSRGRPLSVMVKEPCIISAPIMAHGRPSPDSGGAGQHGPRSAQCAVRQTPATQPSGTEIPTSLPQQRRPAGKWARRS